jgi:hypothetical protein
MCPPSNDEPITFFGMLLRASPSPSDWTNERLTSLRPNRMNETPFICSHLLLYAGILPDLGKPSHKSNKEEN